MRDLDDSALEGRLREVLDRYLGALSLDLTGETLDRRRAARGASRRFGRARGMTLLAAALLLVAGAWAAGIGARVEGPRPPAPFPTHRNGPILVGRDGRTWWIDPANGATLTAQDLPALPGGTDAAAWSRDGRQLAIVVRGDLEVVDPATGARRVVATCVEMVWGCQLDDWRPRSFDWSPDGITIVFTSYQGVGTIDVRTGHLTRIIKDDGGGYWSPTWSPDGRSIAFEYGVPYQGQFVGVLREIQSIRRDGSDRRRLSGSPEPESIGFFSPLWSPDGTKIVYLGSDAWKDTGWALSVMAIDLADGMPEGSPRPLVDLGSAYCLGSCPSVTLSPDGKSVVVDIDDELRISPIDGSESRSLAVNARPVAWRPVP